MKDNKDFRLEGTAMIKSELIQKIAAANQHLYHRDIERIVNVVFNEIVEALSRGDRVELRRLVWEAWGGPVATGTGEAAAIDPDTGATSTSRVRVWAYGLAATLEDGSLRRQPAYYALAFSGLGQPRPLAARPSRHFLATGAYGDLVLVP